MRRPYGPHKGLKMATLKVISTLDPSNFNKGVDGMKRKAKEINGAGGSFGGNMAQGMGFGKLSAGVAAGNLLSQSLSGVKDMAFAGWNELSKLGMVAKSLGAEAPAINAIQDAMAEWGVEGDRVLAILQKIDIARTQAVEGNDKLAASFDLAGASMEDLKKLDPTELFEKMTKTAATGGETGQAMTGISSIVGKRNMAGLEMPMMEFGKGFRKDHMFEPDQRAADIVEITNRKARTRAVNMTNALTSGETHSAGATVSEAEIKELQDRRAKEKEVRAKLRAEAQKQALERNAAELETKKETIRTEGRAKIEEETKGIGFDRMEVSAMQQVGIGALGGGNFDMAANTESMRQVEVAEKTKEIMAEVAKLIAKVEEHAKKTADAITGQEE